MDKLLFKKRIRSLAAKLGILRPLRLLVFRMRGSNHIQHETDFHRRFIRTGDLVFDVGANRGQSSEIYLRLGAKVIAFEPQADLHKEIKQVCGNSRNLTIEPVGLSNMEETRKFYISSYDQVASLRDDWEGDKIGEVSIRLSTLDLQIEKNGLPAYCKIDVEGWELEVLQGLNTPIPLISFEYHITQPETEKALAVLARIGSLGSYFCNVKEPSNRDFLLGEFIPLSEFASRFPSGFSTALNNGYGDIFCATDPGTIRPFQP